MSSLEPNFPKLNPLSLVFLDLIRLLSIGHNLLCPSPFGLLSPNQLSPVLRKFDSFRMLCLNLFSLPTSQPLDITGHLIFLAGYPSRSCYLALCDCSSFPY